MMILGWIINAIRILIGLWYPTRMQHVLVRDRAEWFATTTLTNLFGGELSRYDPITKLTRHIGDGGGPLDDIGNGRIRLEMKKVRHIDHHRITDL